MDSGGRVLYLPTGRRAIYAGNAANGESLVFFVSLVPTPHLAELTQGRKDGFIAWAATNMRRAVAVSPATLRPIGGVRGVRERAATAS